MGIRTAKILAAVAAIAAIGMSTTTTLEARPQLVAMQTGQYAPGTIVIRTSERRLYLIVDAGRALRYSVGVGRYGRQWAGTTEIAGKYRYPAWSPPDDVKRERPNLPDVIEGGSPQNPLGVAAMTLAGTEYAIHGTNMPGSIGGFVSYGCIRMHNSDITDLFERVSVGAPVVVTR
ncbi:MAG: L,D-transpeptidase [Alphaproteobacteria bacterium]|nr:L,D-transpeptidase [Alphaproteobacteria bacterium]